MRPWCEQAYESRRGLGGAHRARLQARVLGAIKASAWLGLPLGSLAGGILAQTPGLTAALLICGSIMLATTLAPLVFPTWRLLERQPEAALDDVPATPAP